MQEFLEVRADSNESNEWQAARLIVVLDDGECHGSIVQAYEQSLHEVL